MLCSWIWAPSWGVQGGATNQLFGDLLALGAKIAPRDPQEPPKSPPRASKTPPRGPSGQILGQFLIDLGCMFGKCFVDIEGARPVVALRRKSGAASLVVRSAVSRLTVISLS